jgi:hypothetical protein
MKYCQLADLTQFKVDNAGALLFITFTVVAAQIKK